MDLNAKEEKRNPQEHCSPAALVCIAALRWVASRGAGVVTSMAGSPTRGDNRHGNPQSFKSRLPSMSEIRKNTNATE